MARDSLLRGHADARESFYLREIVLLSLEHDEPPLIRIARVNQQQFAYHIVLSAAVVDVFVIDDAIEHVQRAPPLDQQRLASVEGSNDAICLNCSIRHKARRYPQCPAIHCAG